MLKTRLVCSHCGQALQNYHDHTGKPVLGVLRPEQYFGIFTSVTLTTAGTQTVVEAKGDNGIVLTDLIISGEKKSGVLTVEFTDGVNTVKIVDITLTSSSANLAIPFQGRFAGWKNCDLQVTTSIDTPGSVTVGYYRTSEEFTKTYSEWNAAR